MSGEHKGLLRHRLADNPEEQRFAEAWQAHNDQGHTLDHLLDPDQGRMAQASGGFARPQGASTGDREVAATVVQWLGSPVGQGFLRDLGYSRDADKLRADIEEWRGVTGYRNPAELEAELADLRTVARGTPTRGHLAVAVNDAGHDRVEAQRVRDMAALLYKQAPTPAHAQALAAAEQKLAGAAKKEQAARAGLAAFEREHGLAVTCREQVRP